MPALLLHVSDGDKMSQKSATNNFQEWWERHWLTPEEGRRSSGQKMCIGRGGLHQNMIMF